MHQLCKGVMLLTDNAAAAVVVQMAVDLARSSARSHQVASLATAGNDRMHQIMAQVRAGAKYAPTRLLMSLFSGWMALDEPCMGKLVWHRRCTAHCLSSRSR